MVIMVIMADLPSLVQELLSWPELVILTGLLLFFLYSYFKVISSLTNYLWLYSYTIYHPLLWDYYSSLTTYRYISTPTIMLVITPLPVSKDEQHWTSYEPRLTCVENSWWKEILVGSLVQRARSGPTHHSTILVPYNIRSKSSTGHGHLQLVITGHQRDQGADCTWSWPQLDYYYWTGPLFLFLFLEEK